MSQRKEGGEQGTSCERILVLTYWDRNDPLVINYTLPYLRIIREESRGTAIHLVTLDRAGSVPLPAPEGIVHHALRYRKFGLGAMAAFPFMVFSLCRLVWVHKITRLHAWCMPAGMLGYLVSVLTGRPLVVDSYEPHAEAMVENGTWRRSGIAFRTLFLFEKLLTRRAVAAVATTAGMREYALARYGRVPPLFLVKPACVDVERFAMPHHQMMGQHWTLEGKMVAVYAGKFGGIYLDQEVFDLFGAAKAHWPNFHVLLLTSHKLDELRPYMERAGLAADMFTIQWALPAEVPTYLAMAQWALTPVRPVASKRYCTPIKTGEYWGAGLPVMITKDISDDSGIIERLRIGSVIESLDTVGYQRAVERMAELLATEERDVLAARIRGVALEYRGFGIAQRVYRKLYG